MALATVDASYGSDPNGLIWGYRFSPGQPAQPITSEQFLRSRGGPAAEASADFHWLHLSLANAASEPWLRQHLALPQVDRKSVV